MKKIYLLALLVSNLFWAQTFKPDTKGELQITNSGTPTYKVPIALPPGLKNVAPQLALVYSGSSVQGMAGMGWNLVGISSISRVSSNIALDGLIDPVDFDDLDRFALDGQRLIEKNRAPFWGPGTTYQTDNYSNLKIESSGFFNDNALNIKYDPNLLPIFRPGMGPRTFTVTSVDGSKAYYGATEDSRGLMNWMINRWIDPQGNYIDYTYEEENNTQRIIKISWGNNINKATNYENVIEFNYKARLRSEYSYLNFNNIKIEVNKILDYITVKTGGQTFRTYTLDHETVAGNYQRVKKIIESNGTQENANPIAFEYENTAEGFETPINHTGATDNQFSNTKLSGDFDGNGEQDFVTSTNIYLNPVDNGSNWTGIPFTLGNKYFTATTLTNGKLNQAQSIVKVSQGLNSINFELYNLNSSATEMNLENTKSINFNNNIDYDSSLDTQQDIYIGDGDALGQEIDYCSNHIGSNESNTFLEGDFDGNGISEVLISTDPNEKYYHHYQNFTDEDGDRGTTCFIKNTANKTTENYLLDLDSNTSTTLGEKGYIKLANSSALNGDKKYVIDFNGDGKSDILIINSDGSYKVVGFKQLTVAPWVEIEVLASGTFPYYNKDHQIVFGDFNGDSKADIMMPKANADTTWFLHQSTGSSYVTKQLDNFEEYEPVEQWDGKISMVSFDPPIWLKENYVSYESYRAPDLDKDGKSDFVVQEYLTWCVNVGWNGCERDCKGILRYRKNIGSTGDTPSFAPAEQVEVSDDYGYETPIELLLGNYRNLTAHNNLVFMRGKSVWKGNYKKDLSKESTLIKVTEAGGDIVQNISYKKLEPTGTGLGTANDLYYSSNSENYPFTELKRAPTMMVVDKLSATANNVTKKQDFKYFGLVTHSTGFGVLGFKKTARSSWYTDQKPEKLWNIAVTNPQLKGATIREFTSKFPSVSDPNMEGIDKSSLLSLILNTPVTTTQTAIAQNSITLKPGFNAKGNNGVFRTQLTQSVPQTDNATTNDYLTRKDYYYNEIDKGNKVTALQVYKTSTKDVLSGTYKESNFTYNSFENIEKSVETNGIATTTVVNTYINNANATDNTYCIGKLLQTNQTVTAYGDTYTTEEKYGYNTTSPNLVEQTQKKGHNTDYLTTDYIYDTFGNLTQKTISAPGVTSRTTIDEYDSNGRFVTKKTDNDGYITTFEYNYLGQVTKSKDYLDAETVSVYDNWGKLDNITTSGASTTALTKTYTYARDTSGYNVTETSNIPGDFTRTFYDVFGKVIKTTKRGFAQNTYISKSIEYDFLGRKIKESEPYFDSSPTTSSTSFTKVNTIEYDYLSRPIKQYFFNGKKIAISYNGLSATTNDGTKTIITINDANENKIEQSTNGETLKHAYYANGTLKETAYGTHKITMKYDGWGRQIYMHDPSVSTIPYTKTYNNFGEMLTDTTPTGTTTITYNTKGKVTKKTQSGQNTSQDTDYTYDTKGFVTKEMGIINNKVFTYNFTYTPYYKIDKQEEVTPNNITNTKTFTYDTYGRLLTENTNSYLTNNNSVNNGNKTIEYGYNTYNGLVEQYKDASTNTVLYKLDTANEKLQALTASLGNGMKITNQYDSYGYFEKANHSTTTTTALNLEYQFQAVRGLLNYRKNNIAGVLSWNETFSYDNQDRLTAWTDPNGTTTQNYEADGRIKNNELGTYDYDASNRYRKKAVTLTAAGNTHYTNRSLQTVTYDMFKNPIAITEQNRGRVDFEYNLSNSRSKSIVTTEAGAVAKTKYYSGITAVEIIEKPNQSLQFITYIAGSPYDAAVALEKSYAIAGANYTPTTQEYLYLHRDYQGTILAISGNGGTIKERRQFDAWGNLKKYYKNEVEIASTTFNNVDFEIVTDRGYTAHEHLFSVGLIHMNARLYDPVLRTFLSADALISDPSNPQNYNRYAYALNNPLLYVDYDGNEAITAAAVLTAAIIGAAISMYTYTAINLANGTAITWEGLAKNIIVGAASGAVSAGIGSVIGSASTAICTAAPTLTQMQINLMLMIPQALMHGIAQGIIQGVSGGNAEQSFWSAAISSVAAGGYAMMPGSFGRSAVGQVLFGAVAGGLTAEFQQKGNFWQGAVIGLTVSGLNHAMHAMMKPKYTVAGINGAGGEEASGNPALKELVEKQGGKMFTSSVGGGDDEIIAYLKEGFEKGNQLKLYGHSRGGAAAVRIANKLGAMNIHISEMTLYDPVGMYFGGSFNFDYPNVSKVTNYYQRNPVDGVLFWANNPFQGSPVSGSFQWPAINNVNLTGQSYNGGLINHLNITRYAIKNP